LARAEGRLPRTEVPELRSVAQLKMLHSLALQLNSLDDAAQIAAAITTELKTLIDYHNCRIYLLDDDGRVLLPIIFRGELTEYEGETFDELVTLVGEGFTGHAVELGRTYYAPDALHDDVGVQIEGTSEIDESILVVPLKLGERATGAIVLSNLGIDQFDEEDIRVVEVLASHAAVAFENARLLHKEREAAQMASALLVLSQTLTGAHDIETVLDRVTAAVPAIMPAPVVAIYLRDPETGAFHLARQRGADEERARAASVIDADLAARFLDTANQPFTLAKQVVEQVPANLVLTGEPRALAAAPLRWDPDGFGALVVFPPHGETFPERSLALVQGVADIASLALGSARRFHELERFHELVESLDAIFWEASPDRLEFTFLSRRAEMVFGRTEDGTPAPRSWGDHIHPDDREPARIRLRAAIEDGGDHHLEYRALGPEGEIIWLRDLLHVVHDVHGAASLRGLIVDITERKRAEQALKRSEQKYSEAFRREREATQRLRALDDMKNTFLEAVSHDLRTPLTAILGSALTLEQAGTSIPQEDSLDLLRRIATNARKLERLLSDLLDVDRLQRGIISPQRRPTDLAELVRQTIEEADLLGDRSVVVEVQGPLIANIDAAKVERIVENLLANAARHTPAGSRIWVIARREDAGVLLIVEDEGSGVPIELREAVFEPFRQGPGPSEHSPGVGVGLSLVARFAELHGGAAWVEERSGGGASFRVYLPEG
jgi:PAS domain S-box-containing protein